MLHFHGDIPETSSTAHPFGKPPPKSSCHKVGIPPRLDKYCEEEWFDSERNADTLEAFELLALQSFSDCK
jgi:hypothetical protein